MSPYVIRYHPERPTMKKQKEYYYDDDYEYYADHFKPRRKGDKDPRPHHHHHHHHYLPRHLRRHRHHHHHGHPHHPPHHHHHHPHHQPHQSYEYYIDDKEDDHYLRPDDHHVHYMSPRSMPPLTYVSSHAHNHHRAGFKMELLKPRQARSEAGGLPARIALEDRRPRWDRESNICFDSCPRKSSKAIPSMHYDELRCPHCAAHVQPSQDEVIAYPWTVQSHRPGRNETSSLPGLNIEPGPRTPSDALEPPAVSDFSLPGRGANPSQANPGNPEKAPGTIRSHQEDANVQRSNKRGINLAGHAGQDPSKPTKRPSVLSTRGQQHQQPRASSLAAADGGRQGAGRRDNNSLTNQSRPLFGTGDRARGARGTYVIKEPQLPDPMPEVRDEDVGPYDSISNVRLPAVRAQSVENLAPSESMHRDRNRAMSEVDKSYPRDKYFQSVRVPHPGYAPSTPRPLRERENRVFKGEYFDRRDGQRYYYNVNLGKRSVYSERRPFG